MKDITYYINKGFAYYQENPKRRCTKNGTCKYSGETLGIKSKGCFIGQWLKPSERIKADELCVTDVNDLLSNYDEIEVPKWMKYTNIDLLGDLQTLHDDTSANLYWNENGLTEVGKTRLVYICKNYNIPLEKITFVNLEENE